MRPNEERTYQPTSFWAAFPLLSGCFLVAAWLLSGVGVQVPISTLIGTQNRVGWWVDWLVLVVEPPYQPIHQQSTSQPTSQPTKKVRLGEAAMLGEAASGTPGGPKWYLKVAWAAKKLA